LISSSGNEEQLASMIKTCNEHGVGIYVDAVFNHMGKGETGCGVGFAGTPYCNRSYENFKPKDFHHNSINRKTLTLTPTSVHHNCVIDFAGASKNWTAGGDPQPIEMWNCDLIGLPDLNVEDEHVQEVIAAHLTKLLELGADGLRIDAAKHMPPVRIKEILDKARKASGKPCKDVVLELFSNETKPVTPSMYLIDGLVEYFQYQKWIAGNIARVDNIDEADPLRVGSMDRLRHIEQEFPYKSENIVTFLDNHDTQRGPWAVLTYRKPKLYTLASIFMLAHPFGYPKVMSSFYIENNATSGPAMDAAPPKTPVHGPDGEVNCLDGKNWVCEHRIPGIANMVKWRKVAGGAPINHWVDENGDRIAFGRGSAFLAMNRNDTTWTAILQTGLPAGKYCDVFQSDIVESCPFVEVDAEGYMHVEVPPIAAVLIHAEAKPASTRTRLTANIASPSSSSPVVYVIFLAALAALAMVRVAVQFMKKGCRNDDGYSSLVA
jgi:alpha-amylase